MGRVIRFAIVTAMLQEEIFRVMPVAGCRRLSAAWVAFWRFSSFGWGVMAASAFSMTDMGLLPFK
jgi:hypothetical protein